MGLIEKVAKATKALKEAGYSGNMRLIISEKVGDGKMTKLMFGEKGTDQRVFVEVSEDDEVMSIERKARDFDFLNSVKPSDEPS